MPFFRKVNSKVSWAIARRGEMRSFIIAHEWLVGGKNTKILAYESNRLVKIINQVCTYKLLERTPMSSIIHATPTQPSFEKWTSRVPTEVDLCQGLQQAGPARKLHFVIHMTSCMASIVIQEKYGFDSWSDSFKQARRSSNVTFYSSEQIKRIWVISENYEELSIAHISFSNSCSR